MIPHEIIREAEANLYASYGKPVKFSGSHPVGGGCINNAFCLVSENGNYFLKWNDAAAYPGMFESEASGLKLLREAGAIKIPAVFGWATTGAYSYILMEWLEPGKRLKTFWGDFGKRLAALHHNTTALFGLGHANYIGSLPQSNSLHDSWPEFYFRERLEPQLKLAVDSGRLARQQISQCLNLYKRLADIVPNEKPALLHGDLWNGNFLVDAAGRAALVDPAVYYGHREMDLAMTRLFGGFDEEFYRSYQSEFPLETGFNSRLDIHQLYPLLVHVNLFGGSYAAQVERILRKF